MPIGPRVKERRKELGLSQENLAHGAGLSWGSIQRLEAGQVTDPHYSTLSNIANVLGTTVAELVGEEPALAGGGKVGASPDAGPEDFEGWLRPFDIRAAYWIENLTSQAELVEHTIARGGYDLKTIWYLEGAAREFWGTYSLTVKKLVREWCAPNQVQALTKAEARMKEARKAATRAYLERRDAEADRQKIDELEPRRRAREAEYARYANAGEAT
jgi:transcriptional regulator with XRE-family HTH domain